ncbi:MAG: hypothetical protein Q8P67_19600 [archaeon]|nr:hypothetical protein [archaeon]
MRGWPPYSSHTKKKVIQRLKSDDTTLTLLVVGQPSSPVLP